MTDTETHKTRLLLLVTGLVAVVFVLMASGAVSLSDDSTAPAVQQADADGFDESIDLADADARLRGVAANDTAGWDVARAGDVNGDGVEDLLVGAPMNDSSAENAGAAYLVYGPADPGEVDLSDADVTFTGVDENDFAGWSVSTAGDLNNDSHAEIVVGAPGNDVEPDDESETGANAGAAYVVYGSENLSGNVSLADANVTLNGTDEYDGAGWDVTNVSNVGPDGDRGIAVGAPDSDVGAANAGATYLLANDTLNATMNGSVDGPTDLASVADATLTGVANGSAAGWAVADAGDVNNDTASEVVVGAPGYNASANQTEPAGAAYVVDTNVSGNVSLANASQTFVGANAGDRAGYDVSTAGDVNNDSHADVVVGAPESDAGGNQSGAAYVVFGAENATDENATAADVTGENAASEPTNLTDANVTLVGAGDNDQAGWSVSAAGSGDVSCDGVADVLVGAPYNDTAGPNAGAAYLVEGAEDLNGTHNLTDANATFVGEARGDWAGWSVATAGDQDNDTYSDVLIGAPYNDSNGHDAGAAYVVNSDCPDEPVTERTRTPTETAEPAQPPTDETPTPTEGTPADPDDLIGDEEETPTEEPATETPTEEPATETPTEEPATETPTEEPATETPTEEPATETPTEEPATETPTEEPATETPTEEPATETPTEEPATETPTEEPVTETPTEEPVTETPTEEPVTETPTEEPVTETPTEEPESPAPAEPPGEGAPDSLVQFQGCNAVQIYDVDETSTLVVEAASGDDQTANQDFPVSELGLEGSGDDQYVTVSIDDFDEAGAGWAVTFVIEPYDSPNPNVDPNSYECTAG